MKDIKYIDQTSNNMFPKVSSSMSINKNITETAMDFFKNLNQVDNVTKNIIREIRRECLLKTVRVDEDLITYFVKLVALDPKWNLTSDKTMTRTEVQTFIKHCFEILSDENSSLIICLKIQLFFNRTFTSREEIIKNTMARYSEQLKPIENELIFCNYDASKRTELDVVYRKIVILITLKSGLGNPLLISVQKEAFMALHSIFSVSDIEYFINKLNNEEKSEFLKELTNLVAGIRLFNWQRGVTKGEGIIDRISDLREIIETTATDLRNHLQINMKHVYLLTTTLENIFAEESKDFYNINKQSSDNEFQPHGNRTFGEGYCPKYVKHMLGLLHITRQCEVYMRKLLEDVVIVERNEKQLIEDFETYIEKLKDIVERRTSIPTSLIFPVFLRLADTWSKLLNERIVIHIIHITLKNLKMCTKNINFEHPVIMEMVHNSILSDVERIAQMEPYEIPKVGDDLEIIVPTQVSNFETLPLQILGFCPIELVETGGALIPGNPNIGVVMWKNMYFAFSSVTRAIKFQKNPDIIFRRVLELARNSLELIFLFNLYDYLLQYRSTGHIYEIPSPVTIKYNIDVQTELHPIPSNIDKNYKWNVWDLKKEAIILTNLMKRRTKSTKTYYSNYRAPVEVQTYFSKNIATSTTQDEYTNVPTLQNYIFGLRGRKDSIQHIIELTRPVHE